MDKSSTIVRIALSVLCVSSVVVPLCSGEEAVPTVRSTESPPSVSAGTSRPAGRQTTPAWSPTPIYGTRSVPRPRPIEGGDYYYELGQVHKKYGVYDKAIEMLETAIEKDADPARRANYLEALGEVYRMKGEPKEAAANIEKALSLARTTEEKWRYNSILSQVYEELGDSQNAESAYKSLIATASSEARSRSAEFNLLRFYQRSGRLEQVIADLQGKLKKNPADEESLALLGRIFNTIVREPSRALEVYEKLSELRPKDRDVLNRLVFLYQSSRQYEKAADVYKKIMEMDPSQTSYYCRHISRIYMLAGKKDEAVKWAEKAISQGSQPAYSYVSLAQMYLQNNLPQKAIELYDRALDACPTAVEKQQISLRFADLFARSDREEQAEKLYKQVLKETTVPSFKTRARSGLIDLYRRQDRTSEMDALEGGKQDRTDPGQ
jgi:tetratricopeptide (TPR) repeat protein